MPFSKEKIKQLVFLMLLAAVLVLAVKNCGQLVTAWGTLLKIICPFLIGGAIAFILNLPMRTLEEKLFARWHGRGKRPVCMLLSFLFVVFIITLVVLMVVPQLITAGQQLMQKIPTAIEKLAAWLTNLSTKYPDLVNESNLLSELEQNWTSISENIISFLKSGLSSASSSMISFASSALNAVVNGFIALIFSFYVLAQKEVLSAQCRRLLTAYLPEKWVTAVLDVCARLYKNFSSFITGQCIEAVILGTMFVMAMSIFKMPYAMMIGVLIAFTALIPVAGAFIGCVVGAFMILLESPTKALAFVVMFLVLQQLENNLIYPRVVGNSVGLPSVWVLVAVTLGGSLFGVTGMLLFIPLVSTLYSLLRDSVNARNAARPTNQAAEITPSEIENGAEGEEQ